LVHAFGAALIDHALGIAKRDVFGVETHGLDEVHAGDCRGTGAVADEFRRLEVAAGQFDGVDEAGGGDDGGAVLVVMENGNVHQLAQAAFDDETFRRLDVFQIDAAEGGAEVTHAIDELIGVFGIDLEIDGIDIGETLEAEPTCPP